jgi:hypothetical protein
MLVVKNFRALPKMFLFTRDMERAGVAHIHGQLRQHSHHRGCICGARARDPVQLPPDTAWDIFLPRNQEGLADKIHDAVFVATCTGFNARLLTSLCYDSDRAKIMLNHHGHRSVALQTGRVARCQTNRGGRQPGGTEGAVLSSSMPPRCSRSAGSISRDPRSWRDGPLLAMSYRA